MALLGQERVELEFGLVDDVVDRFGRGLEPEELEDPELAGVRLLGGGEGQPGEEEQRSGETKTCSGFYPY